ncbi:hypothetical protein D3C84_1128320 [compost metagenome]
MSDKPLGLEIHHKGIQIILGELFIVLVNEPEGGFRVVGNLSRNLPKQLLSLFG